MVSTKRSTLSNFFCLSLGFSFVLSWLWFPIVDIDIWWHLKTGEFIWKYQKFFRTDIFSYTAFGEPWTHHEWLFSVLYYLLHRFFGSAGIIFLRLVVGLGLFWALYKTAVWLTENRWISLLTSGLAFAMLSVRMTDRAAMYSTLGLCLVLMITTGVQKGILSRRSYFWFFAIFFLWANLHAGVILGLVFLLIFWGPVIIKHYSSTPTHKRRWFEREEALLCLLFLVIFLNPLGWRIVTFPFENLGLSVARSHVMEWLSAFHPQAVKSVEAQWMPILFLGLGVFLFLGGRWVPLPYILCLALSAFMSTQAIRFVAEFACTAVPFSSLLLERGFKKWGLQKNLPLGMLLILFGFSIHHVWQQGSLKTQEAKILNSALPHYTPDLMEFLNQNQIHGRVFNDLNLGASFLYFRSPTDRVFIDTRQSVYGDSFFRDYLLAASSPKKFEQLSQKLGGFDYLLLEYWEYAPSVNLHAYLWQQPDWYLVYFSQKGFIYVRRTPSSEQLIQKFGFRNPPLSLKDMVPGILPKNILN